MSRAVRGFGTDVLLTNVISMQIRLMVDPVPTLLANDATSLATAAPPNPTIPAWEFDTATPPPPVPVGSTKLRPRAILIKIRVYDPKNHLTRQISIIQDL